MIQITCEFAGGLQALFQDKTRLALEIPNDLTIGGLILILKREHLKRSPEMFVNDKDRLFAKKEVGDFGFD